MFQAFKKLYRLLSQAERRRAGLVFILMLGTAILEMPGVASIMPFVGVLASPDMVEKNKYMLLAYQQLGFASSQSFLRFLGSMVLTVFVSSLIFKALTAYAVLRFSNMRSYAFYYRLLSGYIAKPYSFFLGRNTADLSKALFPEVHEVVSGGLISALKVLSAPIVSVIIMLLLLFVDPLLAVIVGCVLGSAFSTVYILSRRYLKRIGVQRVEASKQRFLLAVEALNGIKELRLMGREQSYLDRFHDASKRFSSYQAASKAMGDIPDFAIRGIVFGGVLVLVLYLTARHGGLQGALPLIALYAFSGYRLLPAFQEIFKNTTQLRFYGAAVDSLYAHLAAMPEASRVSQRQSIQARLSGDICLKQIRFQYRDAKKIALQNLSLNIPRGSSAAFVGSTGAGKSTWWT